MKHLSIVICAVSSVLICASAASAQAIPPGGSPLLNAPLPPPLPPPKTGPSLVPQMDAPAHPNYVPAPVPSFGDRINSCLDQAAAAGLGPNDRTTYSRNCASR
jgi:hypothetical protein